MYTDAVVGLVANYNELNSARIQELDEEPSALEFMRFVSRNMPFVVRRAAEDWRASRKWSAQYLRDILGTQHVKVAVTPNGYMSMMSIQAPSSTARLERHKTDTDSPETPLSLADAPTQLENELLVFAKPFEEDQPFRDFLDHIIKQEKRPDQEVGDEVRYAQTQNDNLRHEYESLFGEVASDIAFARIALQRVPEAINLWIGNSQSVTALHKDNYENIYVQILGRKHFVLLPPCYYPCVNEQGLKPATYRRVEGGRLELQLDDTDERVPFATWDPDVAERRATPFSKLARPYRVTLCEGDMLYLPAMWFHKVSQSSSAEGLCVAANYWYDMDFSGPNYLLSSFVQSVTQQGAEQSLSDED